MSSERSPDKIRIVAIIGSVRPDNFTGKALNLVVKEFDNQEDVSVEVIDPAKLDLRLTGLGDTDDARRLRESVSAATGIVLSTPEYHGGFSSVLKLLIENLGFPSEMAGKPVALIGVAAGAIGAIKSLEQLRSVCSHVGAIVLPGPVSVAGVQRVFDDEGNCVDASTEKRIRGVATNLMDYIRGSVCPRVALEQTARGTE